MKYSEGTFKELQREGAPPEGPAYADGDAASAALQVGQRPGQQAGRDARQRGARGLGTLPLMGPFMDSFPWVRAGALSMPVVPFQGAVCCLMGNGKSIGAGLAGREGMLGPAGGVAGALYGVGWEGGGGRGKVQRLPWGLVHAELAGCVGLELCQ